MGRFPVGVRTSELLQHGFVFPGVLVIEVVLQVGHVAQVLHTDWAEEALADLGHARHCTTRRLTL